MLYFGGLAISSFLEKALAIFGRYRGFAAIVIGLIVGFSLSGGLLIYNGNELVNSLIYLALVVALPFVFSLLSIFSLLFKKDAKSKEALGLSYLFGTFFSIGALLSLLFIVTTQDIAFGWATTLDIKPNELSSTLSAIAIWKSICSSCVVDKHLADVSQFIRLGGAVSAEQIKNAKELGSWWKFLAIAIATYGVVFRGLLFIITKLFSSKKEVKIVSQENQESLREFSKNYANKTTLQELNSRAYRAIGYHINIPQSLNNQEQASDIVVAVKSWEPPILDFFDYIQELKEKNTNSKISIYLAGLKGNATSEDIDIWLKKLNELKLNYEVVV